MKTFGVKCHFWKFWLQTNINSDSQNFNPFTDKLCTTHCEGKLGRGRDKERVLADQREDLVCCSTKLFQVSHIPSQVNPWIKNKITL